MLEYFKDNCTDIVDEIQNGKTLTDELRDKILKAIDDFGKANNG